DHVVERECDPDERVRHRRELHHARIAARLFEQQHRDQEECQEERRPVAEHRAANTRIRRVTVRLATPDDADAIERVRTDTWRATYRGHMPDAVLDRLGYDGSRRRDYMSRPRP